MRESLSAELFTIIRENEPETAIKRIIHYFAGGTIPIPYSLLHNERNADICKRFNGQNWRELCSDYQLSRWHLYRIIRKQKNIVLLEVEKDNGNR